MALGLFVPAGGSALTIQPIGSKVGILDAEGRILKNADSPRKKV